MAPLRGRLRAADSAPITGEHEYRLVELGHVVIDQILSGRLDSPIDYEPDVDEWVVVLAGAATVELKGEAIRLEAGDWILLPAHAPHRLVETDPGTNWLTVTATGPVAPTT
jgi:cupin 2 domain-containing protein